MGKDILAILLIMILSSVAFCRDETTGKTADHQAPCASIIVKETIWDNVGAFSYDESELTQMRDALWQLPRLKPKTGYISAFNRIKEYIDSITRIPREAKGIVFLMDYKLKDDLFSKELESDTLTYYLILSYFDKGLKIQKDFRPYGYLVLCGLDCIVGGNEKICNLMYERFCDETKLIEFRHNSSDHYRFCNEFICEGSLVFPERSSYAEANDKDVNYKTLDVSCNKFDGFVSKACIRVDQPAIVSETDSGCSTIKINEFFRNENICNDKIRYVTWKIPHIESSADYIFISQAWPRITSAFNTGNDKSGRYVMLDYYKNSSVSSAERLTYGLCVTYYQQGCYIPSRHKPYGFFEKDGVTCIVSGNQEVCELLYNEYCDKSMFVYFKYQKPDYKYSNKTLYYSGSIILKTNNKIEE